MKAQLYLHIDKKKQFYCSLEKNGRMIWRTSESYTRRAGAIQAMRIMVEYGNGIWDNQYTDLSRNKIPKKSTKKEK